MLYEEITHAYRTYIDLRTFTLMILNKGITEENKEKIGGWLREEAGQFLSICVKSLVLIHVTF